MSTRRRADSYDEELSDEDQRRPPQRRTRTRDDRDEDEDNRRSSRRAPSKKYNDDSQDDEEEEYTRAKKEKEKETKSTKTRRPSDEDHVPRDKSARRRDDDYDDKKRRRDDDYDDEKRTSRRSNRRRNERVDYSEEEEEEEEEERPSKRKTRADNDRGRRAKQKYSVDEEEGSSRRSRKRYDDEEEEEDEPRQSRRKKRGDSDEEPANSRRSRRRADDEEEDEEPRKSHRKRRDYSDEEPAKNRRNRKKADNEEDDEESRQSPRKRRDYSDEEPSKGKRSRRKAADEEEVDEDEEPEEGYNKRQSSNKQPTRDEYFSNEEEQEQEQEVQDEQEEQDEHEEQDEQEVIKSNPFAKYTNKEKENEDSIEKTEETNEEASEHSLEDEEEEKKENPFSKYTEDKKEETVECSDEEEKEDKKESKTSQLKKPETSRTNSLDEEPKKKKKNEAPFGKGSLKSVGKVSIGKLSSVKKGSFDGKKSIDKKKSFDNEKDKETDEKKKRRRDKNASSSVLDVINWKLTGEDKYEGSEYVPEVKEAEREDTEELKQADMTGSSKNGNESDEENVREQKEQDKMPAKKEEEEPHKNTSDHETNNHEEPDSENVNKTDLAKTKRSDSDEEKEDKPTQNGHVDPSETNENLDLNATVKSTTHDKVTDAELADSLNFLNTVPSLGNYSKSSTLSSLMDTYLNSDYLVGRSTPAAPLEKPKIQSIIADVEQMDELEKNLKSIRQKNKKQPPPPVRRKPEIGTRTWEDPREQQRQKNKEKAWPPKEPPKDIGAYVVESYGQTDPYSKRLIKDIQRSKREEEDKKAAEKRAEIISESTKPVSTLRSTFTTQPRKSGPGVLKPESNISEERSWIKHEKKEVVFDAPPDEPDWMTLIRNRRWRSTVKARFPCKSSDKTDFERRSTTPKNWKKLASDKNALRMLSEIVGIGAEGEELFMRLANQRQKIEEEEAEIDKLTEEELMAYEVAREALGEDAAYSLQMDNPVPAARMRPMSVSSTREGSDSGSESQMKMSTSASSAYPFTTSQLEAAYLTNQLLRLHPEEFRKLMSLERSRQATLRWQFSADPFDSVHEHQSLPMEIALMASEEPRVQAAMKKILSRSNQGEDSVFGTPVPTGRHRVSRTHSDVGYIRNNYASESDLDGYESGYSFSSTSSINGKDKPRGRPRKKKAPIPPPVKPRGRSVSPSMMKKHPRDSDENQPSGSNLTVPQQHSKRPPKAQEEDRELVQHGGLFSDEDLVLSQEIANLDKLTSNIGKNIEEELKDIEASLEDRKKGFFEEVIRNDLVEKKTNPSEVIDSGEIASRRKDFITKDHESRVSPNVRDELPKTRHKVRRISSSAQLDAVFRRRRQISESDVEDSDDDGDKVVKPGVSDDATKEMSNLIKDINDTFGTNQ